MKGQKQENNWEMNDLDRAERLRREAEFLEYKEGVRSRLRQLMQLSKDPFYNSYLNQMMKDLESGRATPKQVDCEARRSYQEYCRRMEHKQVAHIRSGEDCRRIIQQIPDGKWTAKEKPVESAGQLHSMELKVGIHVFSIIGAIFVFVAYMVFGYNYLEGMAQGIYLCGTTLVVAATAIWVSRKKNSEVLRLIALAGCYICLFPIQGFESGLKFLMVSLVLLMVNGISAFFPNQENRTLMNVVHLLPYLIFTFLSVYIAWAEQIAAVYLVLGVVFSFIFLNIFSLFIYREKRTAFFPLCCIGNGLYIFLLFLIGSLGPGIDGAADMALFVHLTAEVLVLAVCSVIFMLWDREDGRRWAQLYYVVSLVLSLGSFSEYQWEVVISILVAFLAVKFTAGQKEVLVLDCIIVVWTALTGIWQAGAEDSWYLTGVLFACILLLSAFRIKQMYLFHEIVITTGVLLIWWKWWAEYLHDNLDMETGWFYLISAGLLLLLFLIFNFLPGLKGKNQKPYNIVSIVFMTFYYLEAWLCNDYIFSTAMMILGAATIIIVFRERFCLAISRKYLLLAGFLTYFVLTGHYELPVVVSILLMIIALGSVGIGFKKDDRFQRIYGLTMAALVCVKLVLYDFREAETVYRVITFLTVGIIALIISFLYIRLEKIRERSKIGSQC